jgi:hypothetical protein
MRLFHRHRWGIWELVKIEYWDSEGDSAGADVKQRCRCYTCGRYKIRKIRRR